MSDLESKISLGKPVVSNENFFSQGPIRRQESNEDLIALSLKEASRSFLSSLLGDITTHFRGAARLFAAGNGVASILLSPSALYFGQVKNGTSANRFFTLQNNGDQPAQINLQAPLGFTINPSSVAVPPKGSAHVTVIFHPTLVKSYSGYITLSGGVGSVMVSGQGVN